MRQQNTDIAWNQMMLLMLHCYALTLRSYLSTHVCDGVTLRLWQFGHKCMGAQNGPLCTVHSSDIIDQGHRRHTLVLSGHGHTITDHGKKYFQTNRRHINSIKKKQFISANIRKSPLAVYHEQCSQMTFSKIRTNTVGKIRTV